MRQQYNTIQLCRGLAAIMVVATHATSATTHFAGSPPFRGTFEIGRTGVDLFFVISGFIITSVHRDDIGRSERFAPFLWKRVVRIFPTYWVILALLIGGRLLVPSIGQNHPLTPKLLVQSIVLWPNDGPGNVLFVAWSLSFELLFYAIFAAAILSKRLGVVLLTLWFGAIVLANMAGEPTTYSLSTVNLEFMLGIAVSAIPVHRAGRWLAAAGLGMFIASATMDSLDIAIIHTRLAPLIYGCSAAVTIYGLKCLERKTLQFPRFPLLLGAASYSIYLVHYPVVSLAARMMSPRAPMSPDITFLLLIVIGCGAGIVSYLAIERPLLTRLRRWTSHQHSRRRQESSNAF